ncbi:lipocalin family protein [Leeuwenhoekiella sp. A16]|uniref:lipocalin family protein n=1 Tax=unclassified Leeuwenhoekiella TaxID=2615029 RepID=UPI003A80C7ED|tara:strand:+ start:7786 stop:8196 length:411 start_codon:yes stop_codon:yes gene_type:complete
MKTIKPLLILSLLFSFALISCNDDDQEPIVLQDSDLIGKWKLTEIYSDPGDGSGTYEPTDFDKTLEFSLDGQLTVTNGTICYINTSTTEDTTETYSIDGDTITTASCKVLFNFEGRNLVIGQYCIEGCGEKYIKVN